MRALSSTYWVLAVQPAIAGPHLYPRTALWQLQAAPEQTDRRSTALPLCIQKLLPARRPLAVRRCPDYNVRNKTSDQSPASSATVRSPHRIDAHCTDSDLGLH